MSEIKVKVLALCLIRVAAVLGAIAMLTCWYVGYSIRDPFMTQGIGWSFVSVFFTSFLYPERWHR